MNRTRLFSLALRSLRHRATGFVASFLTLLLGATILMTFASLLDTDTGGDPDASATLTIMASVVGGWGLVIVAFAVQSTLTLLVRQRENEMELLRSIGATPGQISRIVVGEATVLAVLAVAVATAPAIFTGRLVVRLLKDSGQIPPNTTPGFGLFAVGIGLGVTLIAATFAALVAARRARATAKRRPTARIVVGAIALASGISCAVLTMTVFTGTEQAIQAVGGQGAIFCAIGLALLAPTIISATTSALARPLRRVGVSGELTVLNLRGQTHQMATALAPIILFTAIATGTLYMQSIENAAGTPMPDDMAQTIETLNYVVVGMIALFTAVLLINTLVATTIRRRREFGQLRLAGSTRPQVLRMVGAEATVLASTGVLFGTIAATATVIPFSVVKTGAILPDSPITTYVVIIALAAVLTMAASLGTARRAVATPAVHAVAVD